jgi:acyl-CoA thioesterase
MGRRIELPDPSKPRTWAQQMALERVDASTFRSLAGAPFGGNFIQLNGEPRARAFGGHVYAQAAWAACQTVKKGFSIHVSREQHLASVRERH